MAGGREPAGRSDGLEELAPETRRAPPDRRRPAAALLAGAALALALGFGTGIFDRGPTELDVSSAYREGSEQGAEEAEAAWTAETERLAAEADRRGRADAEAQIGDELIIGGRNGYNYDAGLEAGLLALDRESDAAFGRGWAAGYLDGYEDAGGERPDSAPDPPERAPPDSWGAGR